MKKRNNLFLMLSLLSGMVIFPVLSHAYSELRGRNGSAFLMTISRDNPNLLMVQGDRVTALTAKVGDIPDSKKAGNGAMLFSSTADKPFTFIVETESGQVFSIKATPVKGQGKVYKISPVSPVSHSATKVWEQNNPYESLLLALNKGILTGNMPEGYSLVDNKERDVFLPVAAKVKSLQVWDGGHLRVEKYRLTNAHSLAFSLNEHDYAGNGVRSVMFWPRTAVLSSGASVSLFIVREQEKMPREER